MLFVIQSRKTLRRKGTLLIYAGTSNWDCPQLFSLLHGLFQGLLVLTFMFMHLRVQIELKLSEG